MKRIKHVLKIGPVLLIFGFVMVYIHFPNGAEELPRREQKESPILRDYVVEQQTMKAFPVSIRKSNVRRNKIDVFTDSAQERASDSSDCVKLRVYKSTVAICVYPRERDNMISSYVRDYGTWEDDLLNQTGNVFIRHKHWTFIDIGCNIGVYTMFMAKLGARVVAIDPLKSNLKLLAKSLNVADLKRNVTLIANAISDEYRQVLVEIPKGNIGGAHIVRVNDSKSGLNNEYESVNTITLDDLIPTVRNSDVFLKVDIEGFEEKLLNGGRAFFQSVNVHGILMEWVHHRYQASGANIVTTLVRNGFLPYADVYMNSPLQNNQEYSWPENVFWIKR